MVGAQRCCGRRTLSEAAPSDRELDILKVLWHLGEGSVREVRDVLCRQGHWAFNTIQTQLRIMEEKGLVRHRREGRAFIYAPTYSRQRAAHRFLDKIFDGALDECMLTMLQARSVSPQELSELERLVAQARQQQRDQAPNA